MYPDSQFTLTKKGTKCPILNNDLCLQKYDNQGLEQN